MTSCTDKLNEVLAASNDQSYRELLWLDENTSVSELNLHGKQRTLRIISNRIDDVDTLIQDGFNASFSDFDTTPSDKKYDRIIYRISKEKLVSHHCINCSMELLKEDGTLILIGRKEDGIKGYFDRCRKILNLNGALKKAKSTYVAELKRPVDEEKNSTKPQPALDDGDYTDLRKVSEVRINDQSFEICSKPGVYGWKKADEGTNFLVETLENELSTKDLSRLNTLDLGCGSGHLSLALSALGAGSITATDNNAAAIAATTATLGNNHIEAKIIASNAGDKLANGFDIILCNPPFHKGFDTSKEISQSFVRATKRLLTKNGSAYFVTNAFVNIEAPADKIKLNIRQIANNKKFKVTELRHSFAEK